jgi:fibronectin-binding autotransporter adhesin
MISLLILQPSLYAADFTWDGGGGNNNWSTGANWVSNTSPGNNDSLIFDGATRTNSSNDQTSLFLDAITFAAGASDFTLGGNPLIIGNSGTGAVTNLAAQDHAFNIILPEFRNTVTISNVAGGTLTFGGGGIEFRLYNSNLTFDGAGSTTINSQMTNESGTQTMMKQGTGMLTLTGTNTFTGTLTVSAGTLQLQNGNALADTLSVTVNGGTLDIDDAETIGSFSGTGGTVNLDANLTAGGAADTIYAGVIQGGNGFIKQGTGTLTLSGTNTYTGATTISDGTLAVNGSIEDSTTTVNTGGTLGGTGTVGNVTINSGGTFAPGNSIGTTNVTGNVVFTAGSHYNVEVNAAGQSDKIESTGTATLTGATVNVQPESGSYGVSTDYTILTAAGGLGSTTFDSVNSNMAFLTPTLSYVGNDVFLNLTRNNVNYNSVANTPNQLAVSTILGNNTTALQTINNNLLILTSIGAQQAFDSLSGVQHTHSAVVINNVAQQFQQLLLQRAQHGTNTLLGLNGFAHFNPLQGHLLADNSTNWQTAATDTSSLVSERGWWLQGFGGFGDIEDTSNATGADYDTQGVAVGLDTEWRDVSVGAAFSYASSDVEPVAGAGDIDSFQLGSYLGWQREAWYVNAALGMGYHQSESNRTIVVGATVNTAEADYDSYHVSTAMEVGHAVAINNATTLTPYVGVNYTHTHRESFTESGAGTANLSVDDEDEDSLRTALGLRLSHELNTGDDKRLTPYVDVAYVREMMDSTSRLDAGFATVPTATFRIDGSELDRDRVRLGVGMRGQLNENTTLNVGYNGEFADSDDNHSFAATINFVW